MRKSVHHFFRLAFGISSCSIDYFHLLVPSCSFFSPVIMYIHAYVLLLHSQSKHKTINYILTTTPLFGTVPFGFRTLEQGKKNTTKTLERRGMLISKTARSRANNDCFNADRADGDCKGLALAIVMNQLQLFLFIYPSTMYIVDSQVQPNYSLFSYFLVHFYASSSQ